MQLGVRHRLCKLEVELVRMLLALVSESTLVQMLKGSIYQPHKQEASSIMYCQGRVLSGGHSTLVVLMLENISAAFIELLGS